MAWASGEVGVAGKKVLTDAGALDARRASWCPMPSAFIADLLHPLFVRSASVYFTSCTHVATGKMSDGCHVWAIPSICARGSPTTISLDLLCTLALHFSDAQWPRARDSEDVTQWASQV